MIVFFIIVGLIVFAAACLMPWHAGRLERRRKKAPAGFCRGFFHVRLNVAAAGRHSPQTCLRRDKIALRSSSPFRPPLTTRVIRST